MRIDNYLKIKGLIEQIDVSRQKKMQSWTIDTKYIFW